MIYFYDVEIDIAEARCIPVWIERAANGDIRWHYEAPSKPSKRSKIDLHAVVHLRLVSKKDGKPISDGKWRTFAGVTANDGFPEIDARCKEVSPDEMARYKSWLEGKLPGEVFDHFPKVDAKSVA